MSASLSGIEVVSESKRAIILTEGSARVDIYL